MVFQKGGFGGCYPGTKTGTRVHSDVPPERKPERGYVRMFPWNENRNEGTFAKTALLRNRPLWGAKKHIKKKKRKQNVHGIVPGFFWGVDFVYVLFSPPQGMTRKKELPPTQSRDNPANLFMFVGNRFLSSAGVGESYVLPIRVPNPSPTLDKNLASMGPGILSSIGVGVWKKAPEAFPDSNTTLDTFQSASLCVFLSQNFCLPAIIEIHQHRSLGNGVRKNGVRNRCPYRRCGVEY